MDKVEQVGGDHYEAAYQHWDYCTAVSVPYLESAATKYVSRWRKKDGVKDLKKAKSYIEKRLAFYRAGHSQKGAKKNATLFKLFVKESQVPAAEATICDVVMHWQDEGQLVAAINAINDLIEEAEAGPTSAYVDQDR